MKQLFEFMLPTVKAAIGVCAFMIGIGWAAYASIYMIVDAKGQEIKREVEEKADIHLLHIDKKFEEMGNRFDKIENLVITKK